MAAMPTDTLELLSNLVAIDSVNPSLVPAGAGEREIAAFVTAWAREAGLQAEVLEATPRRPSVLVRAAGTGGGRTMLLCGHYDTVTVEGMRDPHAPRIDGDRLYGRGAYDMKAGLAAALIACRHAASRRLAGEVIVAAVADEEHASLGVQEVLGAVRADAAIVTEPTELELVVAHKGFAWFEVEVAGRAAHGSRPHLGVDAIVKIGPILTAIGALDAQLQARRHRLLGRPSVHASVIRGGEELSSYPARCVVGLERRTLPGETAADVEAELGSLLDACRTADPELEAAQRTLLVRDPFEVPEDAEIVGLVRDAVAASLGAPPTIAGASYWADAAFIAAAGIPTVMLGPGGDGAHAAEEWVSISDTEALARALVAVAERVCG
jgi:acetylornithine deacetylase